jgi:hypothetical protein
MGIPALEEELFVKLLIFDYLYYVLDKFPSPPSSPSPLESKDKRIQNNNKRI